MGHADLQMASSIGVTTNVNHGGDVSRVVVVGHSAQAFGSEWRHVSAVNFSHTRRESMTIVTSEVRGELNEYCLDIP